MLSSLARVFLHRCSAGVIGFFFLGFFLLGFFCLAMAVPCWPQTATLPRLGMPYDWSHQHVIFSNAPLPENIAAAQRDPRFWYQKIRMESPNWVTRPTLPKEGRRVDWSVKLGGAGSEIAAGMYPAKYSFNVNAAPDCNNDYVVFALNVAGSSTQATIVGYNNLYTEPGGTGYCAGTGPTVKWAYNTGGAINTSPVLSGDGTKVAWVASANPPVLHVLTIGTTGSNGTSVTSPAVAGTGNNAVDTAISYGSVGDTRSSVFADYTDDVAYVAADDGKIYKFTGMFRGTPTEVTTGWPMLGYDLANHKLTSPVFDFMSKNIFYADDLGNFSYIREVGSTTGACASPPTPPCMGNSVYEVTAVAHPIIDSPMVDSITQRVFIFIGNDNEGHSHVLQTDTQLSNGGPEPVIGQSGMDLYDGFFDHNYFTNPGTGFLYVCGYPTSAANSSPVLYRIGFNSSGVMNSTHDANSLAVATTAGATRCSPATEFFNTSAGKDWLFFSVPTNCNATGGGVAGCVMSFDITSGFPSAATQARQEYSGTSAIVVDNVSTQPQASSIYFSTLGNAQSYSPCGDGSTGGGCAVKLTQSGLN
jgi:hypothetical protein